jgi:hypothetical protein
MPDYTNSALEAARNAKDSPAHRVLPAEEVACVSCPSAVWVFVDRTATAKKNAMRQADKPAWRCYCPGLHQWTYDDFSGQPDPECWIYACSLKDQALLELAAAAAQD